MTARPIFWFFSGVALSVVFATIAGDRVIAQTRGAGSSLILVAPTDMKWEPTARPDTARFNLWGDSSKGPFAYFTRYDSGWQLPLHFHTNDLQGVIVSGTFVIHVKGQPERQLSAGFYFFVPGKTQHTDACASGPACVVYFSGEAPLDRINVEDK